MRQETSVKVSRGSEGFIKQDNSQTLTDEQCVSVIRRLAKQRQESIEAYKAGAREDLVAAETAELAVLEGFLPKLASADVTRVWVQGAIAATGATSVKDLGKIMAHLKGAHKDDLDGKLAQVLVKEMLG